MAHNQMLRSGAAWVGVTSQAVGVNGGEVLVQSEGVDIPEGGLVGSDPERYGMLTHPGDLFSYDIFTQAGAAIRGSADGADPFEGFEVERLIAMGESQSAGRLTTYVNAVHPLVGLYDGFLIHSRGSFAAPLGEGGPDAAGETEFPRLESSGEGDDFQLERDGLGIALGGVRTPIVDVPLALNVGDESNSPAFCRVFGYTRPFDEATQLQIVRLESQIRLRYHPVMLPATHPKAHPDPSSTTKLRSRKKARTRLAIEDAALDLFAERGYEDTTVDQIAARAEVSKATFFRYFRTKADVMFGADKDRHQAFRHAIINRPPSEDALTAVRSAMQQEWLPTVDPRRTVRQTRAARTSPVLRGLSHDLGMRWQTSVSEAVARRRGLEVEDRSSRLVAGIAFAVLSNGVNLWMDGGCAGDLVAAIDEGFDRVKELCGEPPSDGKGS